MYYVEKDLRVESLHDILENIAAESFRFHGEINTKAFPINVIQ